MHLLLIKYHIKLINYINSSFENFLAKLMAYDVLKL